MADVLGICVEIVTPLLRRGRFSAPAWFGLIFFTVQLSREYAFFGFAADRLTFEEVDSASPPRSNRRPLHPKLRPGDLCETSFRVAVVSSC